MEIVSLLKRLSEASGVSGYEDEIRDVVREALQDLTDEIRVDKLGSLIALKRGHRPPGADYTPRPCIMLAAHMDEIGLIVTKIEKGFLHFTTVGGHDPRALVGHEVLVHGRRPLPGIVATQPPHVLPPDQRNRVIPLEDMFIDVGLTEDEVHEAVRVGDLVTIRRQAVELQNGRLAGKALDDRACVAAMIWCVELLAGLRHLWDVYAVATVQEEVGLLGAFTSTFGLMPDVGIALDVTFADQPGVSDAESVGMGKGPAIAFGPNIHPKLHEKLVEVAKAQEIPHQIEPIPGPSGTDAWAMQVTRAGLPTALVSIPLRYMHTAVETVDTKDIERTARLLANFVAGLDEKLLETLRFED